MKNKKGIKAVFDLLAFPLYACVNNLIIHAGFLCLGFFTLRPYIVGTYCRITEPGTVWFYLTFFLLLKALLFATLFLRRTKGTIYADIVVSFFLFDFYYVLAHLINEDLGYYFFSNFQLILPYLADIPAVIPSIGWSVLLAYFLIQTKTYNLNEFSLKLLLSIISLLGFIMFLKG